MRIFLAGATGVIGARLVPLLVSAGHDVTGVARTEPKRRRMEQLGAAPVSVDLFDPLAVRRAVAGHEAVINMATSIPPSSKALLPGAWRANDRIRTVASANLAEAAQAAGALASFRSRSHRSIRTVARSGSMSAPQSGRRATTAPH